MWFPKYLLRHSIPPCRHTDLSVLIRCSTSISICLVFIGTGMFIGFLEYNITDMGRFQKMLEFLSLLNNINISSKLLQLLGYIRKLRHYLCIYMFTYGQMYFFYYSTWIGQKCVVVFFNCPSVVRFASHKFTFSVHFGGMIACV